MQACVTMRAGPPPCCAHEVHRTPHSYDCRTESNCAIRYDTMCRTSKCPQRYYFSVVFFVHVSLARCVAVGEPRLSDRGCTLSRPALWIASARGVIVRTFREKRQRILISVCGVSHQKKFFMTRSWLRTNNKYFWRRHHGCSCDVYGTVVASRDGTR